MSQCSTDVFRKGRAWGWGHLAVSPCLFTVAGVGGEQGDSLQPTNERAHALRSGCLGSNPSTATYKLCKLGLVPSLLGLSFLSC